MEISLMVSQLKNESESIAKSIAEKKTELNAMRLRVGALEAEIKELADRHEAIRMAKEALDLVNDSKPVRESIPCPARTVQPPRDRPLKEVRNIHHSRKAKRIGKFSPSGEKIGEFPSINQAAKVFGWNTASMTKYIENTGREKQIRLRGFYLEFIAA